jgi:3',5'-nucleoside bisphosphate phosphatase
VIFRGSRKLVYNTVSATTHVKQLEWPMKMTRFLFWMRHVLALMLLFLLAGAATAQERDSIPVPDIPGYKTLKCDFHMHTVVSDGEVWATTRVMEAWRDGLDAIAITDHSDYHPHSQDVTVDCSRPYELARPVAEGLGIILIPAIEVAENDFHCNVLFVTDPNSLKGSKLIEVLERARAQDAFVFWNHPGWKQTAEWFPLIAAAYDRKLLQGMELVNGFTFYPEAYPWIDEKKLTILSNSDVHASMSPAQAERRRPVTLVFARSADAAGVREALFARRTAAWMGGEVWGEETLLKGLWDGAVSVDNPKFQVRAKMPRAALRLRNSSATPFRLRVLRAPEWLRAGGGELRGQSARAVTLTAAKNAPAGIQKVEIELEIVNFHVAPNRNLAVRLPLEIEVTP